MKKEYTKCLYSISLLILERKKIFLPLLKKRSISYNGKSVIYMLRAFLFYCSLTRQAFLFHTAIRLAYQFFFPLNSPKRSILVSEKMNHKSSEESHFFRFPSPRLISLFSAAITFPRGLHYVHRTAGTFLGK